MHHGQHKHHWAMLLSTSILLCACTTQPAENQIPVALGAEPLELAAVEDNVRHDTLLVQATFAMGDGSFIMVASNQEDTFEGLRLYRYRPNADSSAQILAVSSPAYDSWTMLPSFFSADSLRAPDALWVLANFGEKESWGQKLMLLDTAFHDIGFMDVALPERIEEEGTTVLKRRNIGPFMRHATAGDTVIWRFACDSVFVYDDQSGGLDYVMAAPRLRFTFHSNEGLALWVDGVKHLVRHPA